MKLSVWFALVGAVMAGVLAADLVAIIITKF